MGALDFVRKSGLHVMQEMCQDEKPRSFLPKVLGQPRMIRWNPSNANKCPSGTGCSNIMADNRFYPKGAAKAGGILGGLGTDEPILTVTYNPLTSP